MKRQNLGANGRPLISLLFFAVVVLVFGAEGAHATTVLSASSSAVAPGGTFSIDVTENDPSIISDIVSDPSDPTTDPTPIFGMEIDVQIDPNLLSFDPSPITFGSLLPNPSFDFDPSTGILSLYLFDPGGSGSLLFSLTLDVASNANPGPNPITTTVSFATDPGILYDPDNDGDGNVDTDNDGDGVLGNFAYPIDPSPSTIDMQITPAATAVPEPSTGALILVGLVALLRRRGSAGLRQRPGADC